MSTILLREFFILRVVGVGSGCDHRRDDAAFAVADQADARVVETTIMLDEGTSVEGLTNLQVEVEITP